MSIKTKITIDNSELKKGLKDAENQASSSMQKIADGAQTASGGFKGILSSLEKIGPAGKIAVVAIGALAGIFTGVIAGINKLSSKLDVIGKSSKSVNLTTTAFQSLSHAASICGVAMEKVQKIITNVQYRLAQADQGTKNVVDGFAELGISWSELGKLSPEMQLLSIIQAAEKITDVGKRNKALFKLFEKEDIQSLNKLIEADYGRMVANAKNMGVVIDKESIRIAEAYNDSIGIASDRLKAMVANWKATKTLMKDLGEMAKEATNSLNVEDGRVAEQFKEVYQGIGDAADELEEKLKKNAEAEYKRIQQRIKELAKLNTFQTMMTATGGRGIVTESMAEKLSPAYMEQARKEVMWNEVSKIDSRFNVNDRNTWTQRRLNPRNQSVFDVEKIKADKVIAATKRLTQELETKKKKHEEQLRSYNKEIDLNKEIARIEAETGGKLTDEQKAEVKKVLLEYQVARNKDFIGLIEQQNSKMNDEFEIQKALINGDAKRVEMLKAIVKLKEQGITISEEEFNNNEKLSADIKEQVQAVKNQMAKALIQKAELDTATIDKMGRDETSSTTLQVAKLTGNQEEIRQLTLINDLKQKGIITDEKDLDQIRQKYEELLKIRKVNEETLNQAKVEKMAKDADIQNQIAEAQLKGDYDRVSTLKFINELKQQGVNIDEVELKVNEEKYKALLEQKKLRNELALKQSFKDKGNALVSQAMRQAGFLKQAAQMEAIRNAEKQKGAKLTEDEISMIKQLSSLQTQLNDPINKLDLNNFDMKTNELTARGGFSTGAVVINKDIVNKQIRDFNQRQVQILSNIYETLKNGGII